MHLAGTYDCTSAALACINIRTEYMSPPARLTFTSGQEAHCGLIHRPPYWFISFPDTMFSPLFLACSLLIASTALALPSSLQARQAITALSSSQIAAFKPYTYYASTGYCLSSQTIAWDCGADCEANADFKPITSGGDGDDTPYCTCIAKGKS